MKALGSVGKKIPSGLTLVTTLKDFLLNLYSWDETAFTDRNWDGLASTARPA
jgi:hypothetical protein